MPPLVRGEKIIALAITEPYAGSDVANIRTTAKRDGDHFLVRACSLALSLSLTHSCHRLADSLRMQCTMCDVRCFVRCVPSRVQISGEKKFITSGMKADYFTVAARTGGPGMQGITLFLVERTRPGITTRKLQVRRAVPPLAATPL